MRTPLRHGGDSWRREHLRHRRPRLARSGPGREQGTDEVRGALRDRARQYPLCPPAALPLLGVRLE
eukprot:12514380-Alexandrium_andersonii.AAC.1